MFKIRFEILLLIFSFLLFGCRDYNEKSDEGGGLSFDITWPDSSATSQYSSHMRSSIIPSSVSTIRISMKKPGFDLYDSRNGQKNLEHTLSTVEGLLLEKDFDAFSDFIIIDGIEPAENHVIRILALDSSQVVKYKYVTRNIKVEEGKTTRLIDAEMEAITKEYITFSLDGGDNIEYVGTKGGRIEVYANRVHDYSESDFGFISYNSQGNVEESLQIVIDYISTGTFTIGPGGFPGGARAYYTKSTSNIDDFDADSHADDGDTITVVITELGSLGNRIKGTFNIHMETPSESDHDLVGWFDIIND